MKGFISILFLFISTSIIGQYAISGKIINDHGDPIDFVSIFIKDSNFASISNAKGFYELKDIPTGNYQLKASIVGYESQIVSVDILDQDVTVNIVMQGAIYDIDQIVIKATQTSEDNFFAVSNVDESEIGSINLGQDIPLLLQNSASIVSTSDAGTGIGYTGMRLRGSDQTRINVTLNGVPVNDSESHSVYWVNMPDLSSSISNIEIQRGVGASTNGAGAFGGSVHLNTDKFRINPYAEVSGSYGSFNTSKVTVNLGSGLLNDKYTIDARYSLINSDGYIDRASSELNSLFFSASRISENSVLRFNYISGKEETYQSWYGVPEALYRNDEELLQTHYWNNVGSIYNTVEDSINLFESGNTYNYYTYENQVDKYSQDHIQFLSAFKLSDSFILNGTLNYTKGKGYYEEYKYQEDLSEYYNEPYENENGEIIEFSDLVRRRWLDNDFLFASINTESKHGDNIRLVTGITASKYFGDHFGNVIQVGESRFNREVPDYYFGEGNKAEFNIFSKFDINLNVKLKSYVDLQYRMIDYKIEGDDNVYKGLNIQNDFNFFNPKAGFNYILDDHAQFYASVAVGQKEPVRSDIIDNLNIDIVPEKLVDYELGIKYQKFKSVFDINFYFMDYVNQLVPTGNINDVGQSIRENVTDSYRMGVELVGAAQIIDNLVFNGALTLSKNKIKDFDYVLFDYGGTDVTSVVTNYKDTDIAYSPNIIFNAGLTYIPIENLNISLLNNYVGDQYLDNTSNELRKLDTYFVSNLNATYQLNNIAMKNITFKALINNVFNQKYASNGYTYSYIYGSGITENYYFPQAGMNVLIGVDVKF